MLIGTHEPVSLLVGEAVDVASHESGEPALAVGKLEEIAGQPVEPLTAASRHPHRALEQLALALQVPQHHRDVELGFAGEVVVEPALRHLRRPGDHVRGDVGVVGVQEEVSGDVEDPGFGDLRAVAHSGPCHGFVSTDRLTGR